MFRQHYSYNFRVVFLIFIALKLLTIHALAQPCNSNATTVAGGNMAGIGVSQLSTPTGVYVDGVGNIYHDDVGSMGFYNIAGTLSALLPVKNLQKERRMI